MKSKETEPVDAITLLKDDHAKVKKIFSQFEKTEEQDEKEMLAEQAIKELKVHAMIEEEIFYPAVREQLQVEGETEEESIMDEADEEHHVAKVLIAELEKMDKSNPHFSAKFMVLAENVRHHIKEEESEMLPQAKKTDLDMEVLGRQMWERKVQLESQELPPLNVGELVGASAE